MHLNVAIGVPQRDLGLVLFLSVTHTFSYALASQLTIGEQLWVRYGIQLLCYMEPLLGMTVEPSSLKKTCLSMLWTPMFTLPC